MPGRHCRAGKAQPTTQPPATHCANQTFTPLPSCPPSSHLLPVPAQQGLGRSKRVHIPPSLQVCAPLRIPPTLAVLQQQRCHRARAQPVCQASRGPPERRGGTQGAVAGAVGRGQCLDAGQQAQQGAHAPLVALLCRLSGWHRAQRLQLAAPVHLSRQLSGNRLQLTYVRHCILAAGVCNCPAGQHSLACRIGVEPQQGGRARL